MTSSRRHHLKVKKPFFAFLKHLCVMNANSLAHHQAADATVSDYYVFHIVFVMLFSEFDAADCCQLA